MKFYFKKIKSKLTLKFSLALLMLLIAVAPAAIVGGLLLKQQSDVEKNYRNDMLTRLSMTVKQEVDYRFYLLSTSLDVLSRDRLFVQAMDNFFLSSHVSAILGSLVHNTPLIQSVYLVNDKWEDIESYNGIHGISSFTSLKKLLVKKVSNSNKRGEQWVFNYDHEDLMIKKSNPSRRGIIVGVPIYPSILSDSIKYKPLGYLIAVVPVENIIRILKPFLKNGEKVIFNNNIENQFFIAQGAMKLNGPTVSDSVKIEINNQYIAQSLTYNAQVIMEKYLSENNYINSLKYLSILGLCIIVLAFLSAALTYRWIAKPLSGLMNTVRAYAKSDCLDYSSIERNLRFSEFFQVDELIRDMSNKIQEQVYNLAEKNNELRKANKEKENVNLRLVNFNEQLENKVKDKTKELTSSLQREEKRRSMLQALLSFSNKLQSGDILTTVITQFVSLYPMAGWAIKLYDSNHNVWVCEKLDVKLVEQPEIQPEQHYGHYYCLSIGDDILHCFKIKNTHHDIVGIIVMQYPYLKSDDFEVISLFISQLSAEIEGRLLNEELERIAITDSLTGIGNRKAFDHDLEKHMQLFKRYPERHFGLFMLDVNGLKRANDNYGHCMGDALLIETSKVLVNSCRITDKVYRLGGDEFAIILESGDHNSCSILWHRLEDVRDQNNYACLPEGNRVAVHFAVGYASTEQYPADQICLVADKAMYKDKHHFYEQVGIER